VLVLVLVAGAARQVSHLSLDIDPPGAVRGQRYRGFIRSRAPLPGGVTVTSLRPAALANISVVRRSDSTLAVECDVAAAANPSEPLFVSGIGDGAETTGSVILHTVPPGWDPAWRPVAVAPPDTAVADSTSMVILDASRSRHGAGLEAMHFRWSIDGGREVVKGGAVTSTTLSRGRHEVVLVATDSFGHISRDTMVVEVR
jgi:hypothetical protein